MAQIELNNLSLLLNEIGGEVVDRFKKSMDRPFKHRNGKTYNTVARKNGNTKDSAKYRIDVENGNLYFVADNIYFDFIAKGRKPGSKTPPLLPVKYWMINRGLGEKNKDAYAIARSISINGIEPKPFLDLVTMGKTINNAIDSAMGDLALNLAEYKDDILKAVTKDIVQYLKTI